MPQIGPLEIVIVGVLALLVFGPEKLPEIGRSVGKAMSQFKKMASDVKSEFDLGLEAEEASRPTARSTESESAAVVPTEKIDENHTPAATV